MKKLLSLTFVSLALLTTAAFAEESAGAPFTVPAPAAPAKPADAPAAETAPAKDATKSRKKHKKSSRKKHRKHKKHDQAPAPVPAPTN